MTNFDRTPLPALEELCKWRKTYIYNDENCGSKITKSNYEVFMNRFEEAAKKQCDLVNQQITSSSSILREEKQNRRIYDEALFDFTEKILPKMLFEFIEAKNKYEPMHLMGQKVKVEFVRRNNDSWDREPKATQLIGDPFTIYYVGEYSNDNGNTNGISTKEWFVDSKLNFYIHDYKYSTMENMIFKLGNPALVNQDAHEKSITDFCNQFAPLFYNSEKVNTDFTGYVCRQTSGTYEKYCYYFNESRENREFEVVAKKQRNKSDIMEELENLFTRHFTTCVQIINKTEFSSPAVSGTPKKQNFISRLFT